MRVSEGIGDLRYLARRFIRTEINCRAHGNRTQVVRFLDRAKQHLIESVWQSQQFVVINLDDKWNLVRVLARDCAEHAKRRSNAVAAAFDGQLHDIFRIEVLRIRRERSAGGMLYPLVNRQDRNVTGAGKSSMVN